MGIYTKNEKAKIAYMLWSTFFFLVSMFLFLCAEVSPYFYIGGGLAFLICALFFFLMICSSKGYRVRYLFAKKECKRQIAQALSLYATEDKEFMKDFLRFAKRNYYQSGKIFSEIEDRNWQYFSLCRKKECVEVAREVFKSLYEAITSKGGFVALIEKLDAGGFGKGLDGNYELHEYFSLDLISGELRYLLREVYVRTEYSLYDNGLSTAYTKEVQKLKELLNRVYSPILFRFEEEVAALVKRLSLSE